MQPATPLRNKAANRMQRTPRLRLGSMADVCCAGSLIRDVRRRADVSGGPELRRNFLTANLH